MYVLGNNSQLNLSRWIELVPKRIFENWSVRTKKLRSSEGQQKHSSRWLGDNEIFLENKEDEYSENLTTYNWDW